MLTVRRLAYLSLLVAFAQVVFGAIVRITGSGMGCGDHWPDCYGSLTPAQGHPNLLVEISHRYGAAALTVVILILAVASVRNRGQAGIGGPRGVMRSALTAVGLVV